MSPDTRADKSGAPAADQKNNDDILFVALVGEGGLAEVSLGKLASEKAQASSVKDFAKKMVADHSPANQKLAEIANDSGIAMPTDLNAEHATLRSNLDGMDPDSFDLNYMRAQVVDHQMTAQLLEWEITSGQQASLQRFAAATLPTVLTHLSMARDVVDQLSQHQVGAVPPEPRQN